MKFHTGKNEMLIPAVCVCVCYKALNQNWKSE